MCVSAKFRPARVTRMSTSPGPGSGIGQLGELEHLGSAELGHLDRAHGPRLSECAPPPPYGAADRAARARRGSAGRAACSKVRAHANHRCRIDRLRHRQDALRRARADARGRRRALRARRLLLRGGAGRGARRRGLRRAASWRCCGAAAWTSPTSSGWPAAGRSSGTASTAGTSTRARRSTPSSGVFEGFQPKLSERSRSSDVLFLANIQPDLQLRGAARSCPTRASWRWTR